MKITLEPKDKVLRFSYLTIADFDVLITGLRLARRGGYDNESKSRTNDMLTQVKTAKQHYVRRAV